MKKLLFPVLMSLLAIACSSIDCPVQNKVESRYALLTPDQKTDTLRDTLSISIHRYGRADTLLLNKAIGVTTLKLHVSYINSEDTLFFKFRNLSYAVDDTVWLKKENIPHFESVDCGAAYFHQLTGVRCTHNVIDSIKINNPTVDYDPQTVHFHLYLKDRR